jgi:uncharacterized protein (UPF0332 family)
MLDLAGIFLEKAQENLAAATSELTQGRYNSSANRSYYAVFHAAIYALIRQGIRPPGGSDIWGHDFVQAQFVGQLINRRKRYPASLRTTLADNYTLRELADYRMAHVGEIRARRARRKAEEFVGAIVREESRQ